MKVTVKDVKTGLEKSMTPRFADILSKMGRVTYMTRDMQAIAPAPVVAQPDAEQPTVEKPDEPTPEKRKYTRKPKAE